MRGWPERSSSGEAGDLHVVVLDGYARSRIDVRQRTCALVHAQEADKRRPPAGRMGRTPGARLYADSTGPRPGSLRRLGFPSRSSSLGSSGAAAASVSEGPPGSSSEGFFSVVERILRAPPIHRCLDYSRVNNLAGPCAPRVSCTGRLSAEIPRSSRRATQARSRAGSRPSPLSGAPPPLSRVRGLTLESARLPCAGTSRQAQFRSPASTS